MHLMISDGERKGVVLQWMMSMLITNVLLLTLRQLYIFIFPETHPNCPWQMALTLGAACGVWLSFICSAYLDHYVLPHLD